MSEGAGAIHQRLFAHVGGLRLKAMSEELENQKWVDALGGKPGNEQPLSSGQLEASAIRNSMLRQIRVYFSAD